MTLRAHRKQAALGAVIGSVLGDAMARRNTVWGSTAAAAIDQVERMLHGHPIDIDLRPTIAIPAAVHLCALGAGPPLLVDPDTSQLLDLVHCELERLPGPEIRSGILAKAFDISAGRTYEEAVDEVGADPELAALVGGLVGLRVGLGRIPARLATYVSDGELRGRRYLIRLTERLLQLSPPPARDPERRLGPREVYPGIWVSNIHAAPKFAERHPEGAIISLCATEGRLDHHPLRREFHIADSPDRDENPDLVGLLDEILTEIREFKAKDVPLLVHCRYGASRTGLVLRAWLIEEEGLDAEQALMEAECRWPKTSSWNNRWNKELVRRSSLNRTSQRA